MGDAGTKAGGPRPVIRQLFSAAWSGDVEAVRGLIAEFPDLLSHRSAFQSLVCAARIGSIELAELLLDAGMDVDSAPWYGKKSAHNDLERPLHWAAGHGRTEMVRFLLERGADVNGCLMDFTPLALAARAGYRDIVRLLIRRGASRGIHYAVAADSPRRICEILRRNPAALDRRDEYGTPPLHIAAELWRRDVVAMLLEAGADVRIVDAHNDTVMHKLAMGLYDAALDAFGPRRADELHVRDPKEQVQIAKLLLRSGADANARNWSSITPLHRAVRGNRVGYVRALLDAGADVNAANNAGDTPLRPAVTDPRRIAIARLLIKRGANVKARTRKGKRILELARGNAMKELIQSAGGK